MIGTVPADIAAATQLAQTEGPKAAAVVSLGSQLFDVYQCDPVLPCGVLLDAVIGARGFCHPGADGTTLEIRREALFFGTAVTIPLS